MSEDGASSLPHDKEIWILEKLDFFEMLRNKNGINLILAVSATDIQ
jgi:hypothetical protein